MARTPKYRYVPIPLASGKIGHIMAGPTREMPDGYQLVRCAKEIPVPGARIAFDVGTEDFSTFNETKLADNVPGILHALEAGERLYVGCMGGVGRTGTLLALLVAQNPFFTGQTAIAYIRQVYVSHAVETAEQERQVITLAGVMSVKVTHPPVPDTVFDETPEQVAPSGFLWWLKGLFAHG